MRNLFLVIIFLISSLIFISCKKKKGCVDPNALNYCSDCKENDGSCEYEIIFAFWFDSTFKNTMVNAGVDTMYIRMYDNHGMNRYIGYYTKNQYLNSAPNCNSSNVLKTTFRYVQSSMPDVCGSGGLFGGGTKCWLIYYNANTSKGQIDDGYFTVGPGTYGCQIIKIE